MIKNKTYSSVFRLKKLKTDAQIQGASEHNLRTKQPRNADKARAVKNEVLIGKGENILSLVNNRINTTKVKVRKNAVRALEIVQSSGPTFFKKIKSRDQWIQDSLAFLRKKFGKKNVVHAILHDDESTLHLHSVIVPIVKARYKKNKFDRNGKKRRLKLDAKGILEQMAHLRPLGQPDRAAAEFRIFDINEPREFISHLVSQAEPISKFLATKMTPGGLNSLSNPKEKLIQKRKILANELNRILSGPPLINEPVFADIQFSAETKQSKDRPFPGEDSFIQHRMLLADAFPKFVPPVERRPVGSPTAPFMHQLQVEYFNLCKNLDPEISEPLYRAMIDHSVLMEFYARLELALSKISELPKITITPPSRNDLNLDGIGKYVERENERIYQAMKPMIGPLIETLQLRHDLEQMKNSVRNVNQQYEEADISLRTDNEKLRLQNDALKMQNDELWCRMRTLPLTDVINKLRFPQAIPGKENQFRLPDARVIEINGQAFKEITGGFGLGKMSKRQSAKGAIDLVMFTTGWELAVARRWLAMEFGAALATASVADRAKNEAAEELKQPISPAESARIKDPAAAFHVPDVNQWRQLRHQLICEFDLPPDLIDDLHSKKRIHANQFGALVTYQYSSDGGAAGAVVQTFAAPTERGKPFEIEFISTPPPFELGKPAAQIIAVTETPIDAITCFWLQSRNSQVFAVSSVPSPELLSCLRQRTAETGNPVLVAHDSSSAGISFADKMEIYLNQATIPTRRADFAQMKPEARTPTKTKPSPIIILNETEALSRANPDAWEALLKKLINKYHLDREMMERFKREEFLWATSESTLAVGRANINGKGPRCGVTIMNLDKPEIPLQVLVPNNGGVFWLGANLATADHIVGVANPLEALSYRAIHDLDFKTQETDQSEISLPIILSLDDELPAPDLLKQIQAAGKPFWLRTNTALDAAQIELKYPQLRDPNKLALVDWFVPKPARSDFPASEKYRMWNDVLADKIKIKHKCLASGMAIVGPTTEK